MFFCYVICSLTHFFWEEKVSNQMIKKQFNKEQFKQFECILIMPIIQVLGNNSLIKLAQNLSDFRL